MLKNEACLEIAQIEIVYARSQVPRTKSFKISWRAQAVWRAVQKRNPVAGQPYGIGDLREHCCYC